jgi:aspartate kinase
MLIVQKFGGTSVGDIERIRKVAKKVVETKRAGNDVVVVVSAMAGETDRLINLAYQLTDNPDMRELDVLVSIGEQVSTALLAMAIIELGFRALSLQNHQIKIITDSSFTKAKIRRVDAEKLINLLKNDIIPVIAGFQGIDENGNITTLGRGGSDTTAVAIAASLMSYRDDVICEIYTDVDGVYTADPNIIPYARRLDEISYEEMLELSGSDAKVLQTRSVGLAMKYNVKLYVKSSFIDGKGTLITKETQKMIEDIVVRGIASDKTQARITLLGIPDDQNVIIELFNSIAEANIVIDIITQTSSVDGLTDIGFTVSKSDFKRAFEIARKFAEKNGVKNVLGDLNIGKVSIIGIGMVSHAGVASRMFTALARAGIKVYMISTSEIKISCVIDEKDIEKAVKVLYDEFKLSVDPKSEIQIKSDTLNL